jgi:hypothetical protein
VGSEGLRVDYVALADALANDGPNVHHLRVFGRWGLQVKRMPNISSA